jgi:Gas vesicle synthesis protein GvpO
MPTRAGDDRREQHRARGKRRVEESYHDDERDEYDEPEEHDDEYDEPDEDGSDDSDGADAEPGAPGLSAPLAARAGLEQIVELTGRQPCGVTSLERVDDGWLVGVEVVEDRRIPSSSDILALYIAQINGDGSLEGYHRARRYQRGRGDSGEVT